MRVFTGDIVSCVPITCGFDLGHKFGLNLVNNFSDTCQHFIVGVLGACTGSGIDRTDLGAFVSVWGIKWVVA